MKTLKIKVRPHVLKYLAFHLGDEYELSRADSIGLVLFEMLRRQLDDKKRAKTVESYQQEFAIGLAQFPFQQFGLRNLTSDTIYTFNNHIHNRVMEEMQAWVDLATDEGSRQKDAILSFMAKYNFVDSDIAYDTLKKSYQRYLQQNPKRRQQRARLSTRAELKLLTKQVEQLAVPLMLGTMGMTRAVA